MLNLNSFYGTVTSISNFMTGATDDGGGCYTFMSVDNRQGDLVNFVISPTTYFVNNAMVSVGDPVTGYYDGDAPVPMIFPPQYQALIMVKDDPFQTVKVDYFDDQLVSLDGQLKLNLSPRTQPVLRNGQAFTRSITNRTLIVAYRYSTRSIPAQTTPTKVIVWC